MSNDLINALFEVGGAITIFMNIMKLYKDKKIRGVLWPIWVFYTLWGFWNIYYYPSLGQNLSFYAGIVLVSGNLWWCLLTLKYRKN